MVLTAEPGVTPVGWAMAATAERDCPDGPAAMEAGVAYSSATVETGERAAVRRPPEERAARVVAEAVREHSRCRVTGVPAVTVVLARQVVRTKREALAGMAAPEVSPV